MAKIIVIGPASPLRGGIADLNEAFAESLVQYNYEVEIISFSLQYPKFLFPGKTQYRETPLNIINYKISSILSSINPFSWIKTAKYIIKQNPSKVYIRFWMPFFGPCLGYIAKKIMKKDIPVYSIVDNAIPHEIRFGDKLLTNYFLSKCIRHFSLSGKVKSDIKSLNYKYDVVQLFHPIYNTFNPISTKEKALIELNLKDEKYILFFGLIRAYKGLDLVLEAMSHPKIKEQNIKLLIAGEFYDDQKKYDLLIQELNLNNVIIKNTFIPKDKVPYYFALSNLLVLPYKSATQSGITQLSMYYELPMIVTNVGGLPEVVDHKVNGLVVEPNSINIAEGILYYFSEDKIEHNMTKSMKIKKEDYGWSNFTESIIKNTQY